MMNASDAETVSSLARFWIDISLRDPTQYVHELRISCRGIPNFSRDIRSPIDEVLGTPLGENPLLYRISELRLEKTISSLSQVLVKACREYVCICSYICVPLFYTRKCPRPSLLQFDPVWLARCGCNVVAIHHRSHSPRSDLCLVISPYIHTPTNRCHSPWYPVHIYCVI